MNKILIVEDQTDTLRMLESAVKEIFPKHYSDFKGYDILRDYDSAKEILSKMKYDFVMLDHRIPRIYSPSEIILQFERGEKVDFGKLSEEENKMSERMENIGYSLISEIKKYSADTIIIGTSSMKNELGNFQKPDFILSKLNAANDLEKILTNINILKGGERKWACHLEILC